MKFTHTKDYIYGSEVMLNPSDTWVATLQGKKGYVVLSIVGEVQVGYKNHIYKSSINFPKGLVNLFKSGKAWDSDEVYISLNNWFNIEWLDNDQRFLEDVVLGSDLPCFRNGKVNYTQVRKILREYYRDGLESDTK